MINEWLTRIRFLVKRPKTADLDDELQFHVEQATAANIAAGMTTEEARRRALIGFGGVERAREQCHEQRPGWWLGTVAQDVRYALRGFRRNPVFTITVIATLALGIGATTAVFSVVDRILFRSLPYAQDDRLVSFGLVQSLEKQEFTLGAFFYEWRDNQRPFAAVTFERGASACSLTEANPVHLQCAEVAQNFLPTLGIALELGRNFLPEEDLPNGPKVALISDGLWLSRYNRDAGVLNKSIEIDGHRVRIVGVLPKDFEMPRLQPTDVVLPVALDVAAQPTVNSGLGYPLWAFARLKPGVSVAEAKAELEPLFLHTQQWIPPQIRQDFHLQVRSIRDRQMEEAYLVAWVLLGAVLAVLLIACANVASLFSARGAARQRELAVRSALAARQTRSGAHARFRRVLVAAQIAVSVVLLSGAGLLVRSFWNLEQQSLGIETRHVLTVRVPLNWERYPTDQAYFDFFARAEAALRRLPGVTAVGVSDSLPPDGNSWHNGGRFDDLFVAGRPHPPAGTGGTVVERSVTPDYFRVLQIPLLEGKGFTEEERTSSSDFMILSKLLAARLFPQGDAVGQHIQLPTYRPYFALNGPVFTIVGVAGNVKNAGLTGQDDPEYYTLRRNRGQEWRGHCVLLLETALPAAVVAPWVRSQIAQLDATAPVEIETLHGQVSQLADRPRFETALLGFFALCGLLMAVIGLYGVISFVAAQRTQEIGVRMAQGATRLDILRLIAGEGVRLIVLGGVVGLGAALAAARLLKSLLYNVGPHDPAIYAAVALLLALVALAATLIPARAAMKVEPVEALRYE